MISKDLILYKIKELKKENGGKPPGLNAFVKVSGIKATGFAVNTG